MTAEPRAPLTSIDATYEAFCAGLPPALGGWARRLAHELGLARAPETPWSRVFPDAVLLGLPALLVEGHEAETEGSILGAAAVAHVLAMIGGAARARLGDGQAPVAAIEPVLALLEGGRDQALARLTGRVGQARDYRWADDEVREAGAEARAIFDRGDAVDLERYRRIAIRRQALAFPASQAMAAAAGWSARDRVRVHALIEGATLGLQLRDDVVDWMDDELRGGSWAVALLGPRRPGASIVALQRRFAIDGRLVAMLRVAAGELRRAAAAAEGLGAGSLCAWAGRQAAITDALAGDELRAPGHAVRWEQERRRRREAAKRPAA